MIIKNTGRKIVNVGTTALLPDAELTISNAVAETPAIKILIAKGNLTVVSKAAASTAKAKTKTAADTAVDRSKPSVDTATGSATAAN